VGGGLWKILRLYRDNDGVRVSYYFTNRISYHACVEYIMYIYIYRHGCSSGDCGPRALSKRIARGSSTTRYTRLNEITSLKSHLRQLHGSCTIYIYMVA